jgi:hypothetical protein
MMSETKKLQVIVRAIRLLQDRNLEALRTGEGRGNTAQQMAEILDRELGYSELYEALVRARRRMMQYGERIDEIAAIDAALAKGRGDYEAATQGGEKK